MKQILLSLLAPVVIGGMFNSAFAQSEISDKWVVTPVATMKGVLGALDINFPAGVDRDIFVFQQADDKYVASVSKNAKSFPISPGTYRFTISEVSIENVPVKKGHITRLKSGFINIVSDGVWHINDETKEKQHTSGNKPRKVALPVGSYQLNLGGQFHLVTIKDGETVEDYTPVEIKNETPGNEKLQIIGTNPQIAQTSNAYWVLSPVESIPDGKGRLNIFIPKNDTTINIAGQWVTIPRPIQSKIWIEGYDEVSLPKVFSPQTLSVRLNNFLVKDVPINDGKETRLKAGFLTITTKHDIYLESEDVEILADLGYGSQPSEAALWTWELYGTTEKITGKWGKIYALPPGVYILKKSHPVFGPSETVRYTATINDGQRVTNGERLNSSGSSATSGNESVAKKNESDKWVITPVATMKGVLGALDINFPAGVDRDIWIYQQADNKYVASVSKNAKSFPISPGEYRFTISEVSIENVPIKKGHVTRLKSGFINIVSEGVWHINDETKEKQHTSGNKPRKVALPVGSYQLNLGGQFYPVIIKDGGTVEL